MRLFLYGTLRHAPLREALLQRESFEVASASLADHTVLSLAGTGLPQITEAPGKTCEGVLLTPLSAGARARLDAYEAPFGYLPQERKLSEGEVVVYIPHEPAETDGEWWLKDWVAHHGERAVIAAEEIGATDPPLTGEALRREWHMIQGRAAAALRARNSSAPATVRSAPERSQWRLTRTSPPQGAFFRFQQYLTEMPRFDDPGTDVAPREVFHAADAALVLPFDPITHNVLLVEQFRLGPAARQDANPMVLEPIAGMIDAGETPEDTAHREGAEEAGLKFHALEKMFEGYATPGAATDHFYCYLGLCDLAQTGQYMGGLEDEAEHLRLHILPFAKAIDLMKTGEITALPLITMLLWLEKALAEGRFNGREEAV